MVGLESASGSVQAITTVGIVLAEAIVLYAGYGVLGEVVGSDLIDAVGGE